MDAPGIPLDFTRDDTFWFEDGSVVLIAQNIGFRVYRELLTLRSEVFRDLFGLPQPQSEESQLVCGCPLIHVSDTSIAFKELLRSLLLGRRYVPDDDPELTCLSYRIRLAHKYGIEDLLEDSI
ncbi:hypothetical protein FOMPIDRAFT_1057394 [Fomitopsis schrenkii]|uniref:BTB domain-containing protein n=1 Tax=Fomitopsis schrenkii TaxID=2126942 RepID=S8EL18_FOMSC|nr:hypothetical protein FOMPIDRAFT_1057394 [Fomitopsis schrenkii]